MSAETDWFIVHQVRWQLEAAREVTGTRDRPSPLRTAILDADLECKICGSEWIADYGTARGQLKATLGTHHVACPKCLNEGAIPNDLLQHPDVKVRT